MIAEHRERFARKDAPPNEAELAEWLGTEAHRLWRTLARRIANAYPGIFAPDWVFGGAKHGWGLRYKKSKSFCTFVPARGTFSVAIVFGVAERATMEDVLPRLGESFRLAYAAAQTFHDGKWVLHVLRCEADLDDVMAALATKRRPRQQVS